MNLVVCVPIREKIWGCSILWRGKSEQSANVFSAKTVFSPICTSFIPQKFSAIRYSRQEQWLLCVYCSRQLHVAIYLPSIVTYMGLQVVVCPFSRCLQPRSSFLIVKSVLNHLIPSEEALDCLIFSGSKFKLQWDVIDLLIFVVQRSP